MMFRWHKEKKKKEKYEIIQEFGRAEFLSMIEMFIACPGPFRWVTMSWTLTLKTDTKPVEIEREILEWLLERKAYREEQKNGSK